MTKSAKHDEPKEKSARPLQYFADIIVAEVRLKGIQHIGSIVDLSEAGVDLQPLQRYCAIYALDTQSLTYRRAYDRIARYIEKKLS